MTGTEIDAGSLARSARRVYVAVLAAAGYEAADLPAVTGAAWDAVAGWLDGVTRREETLSLADAGRQAAGAFRRALPVPVVSEVPPRTDAVAWQAVAQHLFLALYGEGELRDLERAWPAWVRERLGGEAADQTD